jgi:hypothetical protein
MNAIAALGKERDFWCIGDQFLVAVDRRLRGIRNKRRRRKENQIPKDTVCRRRA